MSIFPPYTVDKHWFLAQIETVLYVYVIFVTADLTETGEPVMFLAFKHCPKI